MPASVSYSSAEFIRPIIRRLIEENLEGLGHLSSDMFVLRQRVSDSPAKWATKLSKVPKPLVEPLGNAEFLIVIDQQMYALLNERLQEAVIFEQLCSIVAKESGDYVIAKEDVKLFLAAYERYGNYKPELAMLTRIAKKKVDTTEEEELEESLD